jgi:hypothetical protein
VTAGRRRRRAESETHVGVISGLSKVTTAQERGICLALSSIDSDDDHGRPVLHHGCGPGADVVAHRFVRRRGGWLVHGHPASDTLVSHAILNNLDDRKKSASRGNRDAGILAASRIILVVMPYPRYGPRSGQPDFPAMIRAAEAAGKTIVYVPETADQQGPAERGTVLKPVAGSGTPSPAGKDAAGTSRQGGNDARTAAGNHDPRQPAEPGRDRRAVPEILAEWHKIAVRTLGARAEVRDSAGPVVVVLIVGGKAVDQFPVPRGRDKALKYVREFDEKVKRHRVHAPELLTDEWR